MEEMSWTAFFVLSGISWFCVAVVYTMDRVDKRRKREGRK